eukprot:4719396-Pleurochrysis_carterae.AAC.1
MRPRAVKGCVTMLIDAGVYCHQERLGKCPDLIRNDIQGPETESAGESEGGGLTTYAARRKRCRRGEVVKAMCFISMNKK